jgi:copper homeostasis protein (lipoprotein)
MPALRRAPVSSTLLAAALLAACGGKTSDAGRAPDSVVTIDPSPTVTVASIAPASYRGPLPCPDCTALRTTVALWPDSVYRLQQVAEGKSTEATVSMGRWRVDDGMLSLETDTGIPVLFRRVGGDTLQPLDPQGKPVAAAPGQVLVRTDSMDALRETAPYTGTFSYEADAPTFRECGSGQTYPVLQKGEYRALERAFRAAKLPPGSGQQVMVSGRFLPRPADMEGPRDRDVLEVLKYIGPGANPDCR